MVSVGSDSKYARILFVFQGLPDTGLLSYGEMRDTILSITETLGIPLIADADTGFGSDPNVRRTVLGYAAGSFVAKRKQLVRSFQFSKEAGSVRYIANAVCTNWVLIAFFHRTAGAAGLLIEDQVQPKKCGHTRGKAVVSRAEAVSRVSAACEARDEADCGDGGPVIIARTDAGREDFEEALERARIFHECGADITFVEAPRSVGELSRYAEEVPGMKLANMLEGGESPILPPSALEALGYKIAAYPLSLLSAAVKAQENALVALMEGDPSKVQPLLKDFTDLQEVVGFQDYYQLEDQAAKRQARGGR